MKKNITILLFILGFGKAYAQFGAANCTATIANNAGPVNFSSLTWTGTGCPNSGTTSYTGNLKINLGSNASIVFNNNLSVTGNLQIDNGGTNSRIVVPEGITLQVTGNLGDEDNNNAVFVVNGTVNVGGGIYGKNNNAFDATGDGQGSITAGSLNFQGAPTCVSPANCSGMNWSVGSCSPSGSTFCTNVGLLPVSLIFFNAAAQESSILLTWATATEVNAHYFAIEKSYNGKDFFEIDRVNAVGNSSIRHNYAYEDKSPLSGRTYYRLKEVDIDEYTEYFNIVSVNFSAQKSVIIFPNPVLSGELNVYLNFLADAPAFVTITDISGLELTSFQFNGPSTRALVNLSSGNYILKLRNGKESFVTRFVVK